MATAMINEDLLEMNIAYFKDTLLQIQCHNYNWVYEKVLHAVANMLIRDLKQFSGVLSSWKKIESSYLLKSWIYPLWMC